MCACNSLAINIFHMVREIFDLIEKMNRTLDPFSNIKKIISQAPVLNHPGLQSIALPNHMLGSIEFANEVRKSYLLDGNVGTACNL